LAQRPIDMTTNSELSKPQAATDPERDRIVAEEQTCLDRVLEHVATRRAPKNQHDIADYDARLLDLRDQIAQARLEDVPPLVQEMERLQVLAARLRDTTEVQIDAGSPYFGRLVLEENGRKREVLIGRGTYLDTQAGIRIVDWRDAPVSRLFYRYDEGADYDEEFGGREVSGTVHVRRSLVISDAVLERISAPQGAFARQRGGGWKRLAESATRLAGGAGSAIRAEQHHKPGRLGTRQDSGSEDKVLREITALIDKRQFDLITRPDSGLVVIQGGAGSGKTTIGLHRLAYLAFRDSRRFRPDKLLVIVFNTALARYIAGVLPALGVNGVAIRTYEDWASRLRQGLLSGLPARYRDDTPAVVTRLKKHPAMLDLIDRHVASVGAEFDRELNDALSGDAAAAPVLEAWNKGKQRVPAHRLHALSTLLEGPAGQALSSNARISLERLVKRGLETVRDVFGHFAELFSDRTAITKHFAELAPSDFQSGELSRAITWCEARISEVLEHVAERAESKAARAERAARDDEPAPKRSKRGEDDDDRDDSPHEASIQGIDGRDVSESAMLDVEDDSLLLRLSQRLRGPLTRGITSREPVLYEHVLIDEAQDLSPVELAVVLGTVTQAESVTLAGDVQQRLLMDNGFSDFQSTLARLNLKHVQVEPLKLSYRSTHEIIDFARAVLGPLASPDAPQATRSGAPVELFRFGHTGNAVAFLGEALRELMTEEPNASVAIVTRYPEQADTYYAGLQRAEIPKLRRIADQDFPFKPGIDVTDVRQVKGLEFDYVVLVEVNEGSYPAEDESRHLLHIGATRAAHQLWIVTAGKPSVLLPAELVDRAT
jgi:DNA helicase-2/ATP-dependent DNA helicase PcrA